MHRILVLGVTLVLGIAPAAQAAGVASRGGSGLVFRGGDGPDSLFVRYSVPPNDGVTEPSFVFLGGRSRYTAGRDTSVTAGPGCAALPFADEVACPAAGVEQVDLQLGGGDDSASAGSGTALRVPVTVRGRSGNDSIMADEIAPSGPAELYGEDGNDMLTAFSRDIAAAMFGGPGNDRFIWEQTARGVPTSADGGPGDDVFDTRQALGPDTIVGGGGADQISVLDNRRGDPDSVSCGLEGVAQLAHDPDDHIAPGCRLDAFRTSMRLVKRRVKSWRRATVSAARIDLRGLRVPRAGAIVAIIQVSGPAGYATTKRRVHLGKAGPVALRLRPGSRFRSVARTAGGMRLLVRYRPPGGLPRETGFYHGLRR